MEKIVRREGIGDILANGVYWAARQIGKGAEAFDHNTMKKFEQVPIKLGTVNYPYFLMYATGEKMNITQTEGSYPQIPIADKEERQQFVDAVGRGSGEVQEVVSGLGAADAPVLRGGRQHRRLERDHALRRRRHRHVRLLVVVQRSVRWAAAVSHLQPARVHLGTRPAFDLDDDLSLGDRAGGTAP